MKKLTLLVAIFYLFIPRSIFAEQCGGKEDFPIQSVFKSHQIAPFYTVVDWSISTEVKEDRCPGRDITSPVARGTKVFVWIRSAGNKAALDYIIKNYTLPLKHAWQHQTGDRWRVREVVTVSGCSITDKDISGLNLELKNREFFDWRTWSCKEDLTPGRWRVTIIDRFGAEVKCIGGKSEFKPCFIEFDIE